MRLDVSRRLARASFIYIYNRSVDGTSSGVLKVVNGVKRNGGYIKLRPANVAKVNVSDPPPPAAAA